MKKINLPVVVFGIFILLVLAKKFLIGNKPSSQDVAPDTLDNVTESISQSWFGQLMSNLDLSNTTLGKPVVELVGATWAPIVLIIAAVALVAVVILLIRKGGAGLLGVLLFGALVAGIVWSVVAYIEEVKVTSNVPIELDMRQFRVGDISKEQRVGLMTTTVILLAQTIKGQHNGVYWACPTTVTPSKLPFQPKFKVAASYGGTKFHFVLTDDSKQELLANGTTVIGVKFTLALSPGNPCKNLLF